MNEQDQQQTIDLSTAPIRKQLLLANIFPLVLFGILLNLVISTAFHTLTLDFVIDRSTAQLKTLAVILSNKFAGGTLPETEMLETGAKLTGLSNNAQVYLFDPEGQKIYSSEQDPDKRKLTLSEIILLDKETKPFSRLIESSSTNDQLVISSSSIEGFKYRLIIVEPWKDVVKTATQFQILLASLTALGIILSLVTLSLAISRIIKPIRVLSENASNAVPGSIFHPIKPYGPEEIRTLTTSFNHMVIQLSEQQSALRQYSHQALLSQEKERQRISHELHDGILQDLVGLSQRVELYRNELQNNPNLAKDRLTEFDDLINRTIDEVRRISIALRPPVLEDFGLTVAINALCKEMNQYHLGIICEFSIKGNARRLDADLELAVYRVVQEALANIRKHVPKASFTIVELEFGENEVTANICNDGGAFTTQDMQHYMRSGHLGLAGMHERARLFGGELTIDALSEEKTSITIRLPYRIVDSQIGNRS